MLTKLYLVRHGRTNVPDAAQVAADPLSELGRKQIAALGKRLQRLDEIERIFSSEIIRAKQTAEIIGQLLGKPVNHTNLLNELPVWTSPTELHDPATSPERYHHALRVLEQAEGHAISFLEHIAQNHAGKTMLIVSHGNIIRAIIANAIDAGIETTVRFSCSNASLSLLEYDSEVTKPFFRLSLFNDISHLG